MSRTIGKMAPTAAVVALVAWCCWPYLDGPGPAGGVQQGGELPQIAAVLLSPDIQPAPERDPFRPPDAGKTISTQGDKPTTPAPGRKVTTPEADSASIFKGLALDATYIQGNRRFTVINGQVCAEGDRLAIAASTAEPWVVTQISADKVLILHQGRTLELKYPALDFRADPTEAVEGAP